MEPVNDAIEFCRRLEVMLSFLKRELTDYEFSGEKAIESIKKRGNAKNPKCTTEQENKFEINSEGMPKIYCLVDVCMVPIGTASASVSDFVTLIERKIRESPLKSTLHSAGTTIEGPWDEVFTLLGEIHEFAHENGYVRIQTSMRVGTRTDKHQTAADKVETVLKKLGESQ